MKSNWKIAFALVLSCFTFYSYGQHQETIQTDRPGQSVGPLAVGKNIFQTQTGINYTELEAGENTIIHRFNYANVLRYGVTETFEIRTEFQLNRDRYSGIIKDTLSGLNLWSIGMRSNILDNSGTLKPTIGFQADVFLNAVSKPFRADHMAPSLRAIHSQSLSAWLGLTTNWGIYWNGVTTVPEGFYTINLSFQITDNISTFIENYGSLRSNDMDSHWDSGVAYLATNNLMLDLSLGYGKNEGLTNFFVDSGLSWRIKLTE